jgi:hypothetical protein
MSEPMSDERLANIGAALRVTEGPTIAHELYGEVKRLDGHLAAIGKAQAESVAARRQLDEMHKQEVAQLRARLAELRTEYGARVTYADTLTAEGPIADTLDEAQKALAGFDAKGHANVVSRELVEREVTEWRGVGSKTAQQPEDGDRG